MIIIKQIDPGKIIKSNSVRTYLSFCKAVRSTMENKRVDWVDTAKGLGMLFVLIFHALPEGTLYYYFASFHLPLFSFLSGFVYSEKYSKNFESLVHYVKKKSGPLMCRLSHTVWLLCFFTICSASCTLLVLPMAVMYHTSGPEII